MSGFIAKGWESYRKLLPADASEVQVRETRQAFYAGAAIIFEGLMRAVDGGDEPTDRDMRLMADIQAEIDAFGQALDRWVFGVQEH